MKTIKRVLLVALFVALGIAAAVVLLEVFLYPNELQRKVLAQEKLRALGRVVLIEYDYRSLLYIKKQHTLLGLPVSSTLVGHELLLAVPYKVRIGLDLLDDVKIEPKGRTLYVSYRLPYILSLDVVHGEIQPMFDKLGIFSASNLDDFLPDIENEKLKIRQQAQQRIKQSDINGVVQQFIKVFFQSLGYTDYIFAEIVS